MEINITGVIIRKLTKYNDNRGWLMECFRQDEILSETMPVMSYVSMTNPGIARGPHEHLAQTDYFCFFGSTVFKVYLWDNRKSSGTFGHKQVIICGEDEGVAIIVPPGVVHAYQNVGNKPGLVLNYPNKLFAGRGKKEKVDEVRHENDLSSPFKLED